MPREACLLESRPRPCCVDSTDIGIETAKTDDPASAGAFQLLIPPTVKQDLHFLVVTIHKVRPTRRRCRATHCDSVLADPAATALAACRPSTCPKWITAPLASAVALTRT